MIARGLLYFRQRQIARDRLETHLLASLREQTSEEMDDWRRGDVDPDHCDIHRECRALRHDSARSLEP